jgi:hypothetical protein
MDTDEAKSAAKGVLVDALRYNGLLESEDSSNRMLDAIARSTIWYTYTGGGIAGLNSVCVDFLQLMKFQEDFERGTDRFPMTNLATGCLYHEFGHVIQFASRARVAIRVPVDPKVFEGMPFEEAIRIPATRCIEDLTESFCQGVCQLAMSYQGLEDSMTEYYKAKEQELQSLDPFLRARAAHAFLLIGNEAGARGLRLMSKRSHYSMYIYTSCAGPSTQKCIERFANPLSVADIRNRIMANAEHGHSM